MISAKENKRERSRNRWLLLFYDSILLLLVWLAVFVVFPSTAEPFSWLQGLLNCAVALGSFFAFRMTFRPMTI